ncbi:MAG: 3-deoxy-D-manno-octulosonate 8-phosphate phosphatase (KDO 8-P phosphatase) [Flavobacteriales bacterium]|jgi:3-deoxy-D-manno-octulosonate 8-phosphate phosphatase (KDO 8-P phosphatase)
MPQTTMLLSGEELLKKAHDIQLLVVDVDGVLTDGQLYFDNDSRELNAFHTFDGQGLRMLKQSGVEVGIISGRNIKLVENRASDLGMPLIIKGREDKYRALQDMLSYFPCELENIAYMGDDWPDLTIMSKVGLALSVASADIEVKIRSHWVSSRNGGQGAVRQACNMIMKAQNNYDAALNNYLKP